MNTQFKFRFFMIISILLFNVFFSNAQDNIPVGKITDGVFKFTDKDFLQDYFFEKIGKSGTINPFAINYSPDGDLIYITAVISDNSQNITCIGISLIVKKGIAYYIRIGNEGRQGFLNKSSVTNTCVSENCKTCKLIVTSWNPFQTECKAENDDKNKCKCQHSLSVSTTEFQLDIPPQEK
jgi:hypothetical protein